MFVPDNEEVSYGLNMINALDVSDEFTSNQKICIIDSGLDISHEDLDNVDDDSYKESRPEWCTET